MKFGLILFYALYLSLAYSWFPRVFQRLFYAFYLSLAYLSGVSEALLPALRTLSISCLHRVFCDVSEALTLALCTLLRFIALPDRALRLAGICTLPVSREPLSYVADTPWPGCYPLGYRFGRSNSLTTIDDRGVSRLCACSGKTRVRLPLGACAIDCTLSRKLAF